MEERKAICPVCRVEVDMKNRDEAILLSVPEGIVFTHEQNPPADRIENSGSFDFCLCDRHLALKESGFITLAVIDPDRSLLKNDEVYPWDAYLTGQVFSIKREVHQAMIDGDDEDLLFVKSGYIERVCQILGIDINRKE